MHASKKILGGYKNRFKSFFIDEYNDKIIVTDYLGGTYSFKTKDLGKIKITNIKKSIIKNNLKTSKVLDTLIHNNLIFVSYIGGNEDCETKNVAKSKLDNSLNLILFLSTVFLKGQ